LFIFNGLTAFSFRAISHIPFLDPQGPDRARLRDRDSCLRGTEAGHAIFCDRVILGGGSDMNLSIVMAIVGAPSFVNRR
jgi:hypothetical protein